LRDRAVLLLVDLDDVELLRLRGILRGGERGLIGCAELEDDLRGELLGCGGERAAAGVQRCGAGILSSLRDRAREVERPEVERAVAVGIEVVVREIGLAAGLDRYERSLDRGAEGAARRRAEGVVECATLFASSGAAAVVSRAFARAGVFPTLTFSDMKSPFLT
jgi:hypothetical protein